jgi:hypothetical protein
MAEPISSSGALSAGAAVTVLESAPANACARTVLDNLQAPQKTGLGAYFGLKVFRGYPVKRVLSAAGGEADIHVLEDGLGREYVLRLYRQGREPKAEVFQRLVELGRELKELICVSFETGSDESTGRYYEIQEYFPLGDLAHFVKEGNFASSDIIPLVRQLAEVLKALHSRGIVHRDLKPDNILLRSDSPLKVALADFGISSMLYGNVSIKETRAANTPLYSAPESFADFAGVKGDYWSLGVIILELILGRHPLAGASVNMVIREISVRGFKVPADLEPHLALLIKGLLTRNDKKRWGQAELDLWLAGRRDVPVFYEEPRGQLEDGGSLPYRFRGKQYFSLAALAESFAVSFEDWEQGREHLARGYLRSWLENTGQKEAAQLLARLPNPHPDGNLFALIQYAAGIKGHYWRGVDLNSGNILKILEKSEPRSSGEKAVLEDLREGKLSPLVSIAHSAQNPFDGITAALLTLAGAAGRESMPVGSSGQNLEDSYAAASEPLLLSAIKAAARPKDYFLGTREPLHRGEDILAFFLEVGRPLLTVAEFWAMIPQGTPLPLEILADLGRPLSYAEGVRKLELLGASGAYQPQEGFSGLVRPVLVRGNMLVIIVLSVEDFLDAKEAIKGERYGADEDIVSLKGEHLDLPLRLQRALELHRGPYFWRANLGPFLAGFILTLWFFRYCYNFSLSGYKLIALSWLDKILNFSVCGAGFVLAMVIIREILHRYLAQSYTIISFLAFIGLLLFAVFLTPLNTSPELIKITASWFIILLFLNRWRHYLFYKATIKRL